MADDNRKNYALVGLMGALVTLGVAAGMTVDVAVAMATAIAAVFVELPGPGGAAA